MTRAALPGELELGCARGGQGWRLGGEPEVLDDLADDEADMEEMQTAERLFGR